MCLKSSSTVLIEAGSYKTNSTRFYHQDPLSFNAQCMWKVLYMVQIIIVMNHIMYSWTWIKFPIYKYLVVGLFWYYLDLWQHWNSSLVLKYISSLALLCYNSNDTKIMNVDLWNNRQCCFFHGWKWGVLWPRGVYF